MAFWSDVRLKARLPSLIAGYDVNRVDCSAYRLRVGDQAFVTSDGDRGDKPADPVISVLGAAPNHTIKISPGQFAFLLTEEVVKVPADAIALISMRAGYKNKGLINVSGFHVDPGWDGKLLFSVYNAGPAQVILTRFDEAFLIVYADLDQPTANPYRGKALHQTAIDVQLVEKMASEIFSPHALQKRLAAVDEAYGELKEKYDEVRGTMTVFKSAGAVVAAMLGIFLATVAVLPSWTGVVIARTLDAANYEIKQKPDSDGKVDKLDGKPTVNGAASAASAAETPRVSPSGPRGSHTKAADRAASK
jgi:dCTP deaminase